MSSSNKKTFKTSETTKAIDATVTSDAILLDPTTTDHVLVVTADSSANLIGNVDVELEMSPDGENWCPAKVKQVTTTEETQGDPIEGNEKAVNLIKDTEDAGDYKNKFARGRLEYDLSTNQLYEGDTINEVERTDASDFMHHMIATNKSFNFSGWFNSDQQPSNTYTPVLFRHGGLDTFTNLKTVQLTGTGTQNLCNDTEGNNFKYITAQNGSHTAAEPCWELTGTDSNLFSLSGNSMISISDAWSVSMKVDFPRVTNTSTRYLTFFSMFTDVSTSGSGIQIIHKRESTTSNWQKMRIGISDGSRYWYRDYTLGNPTNEFGHLVVVKNSGGFSSSTDPFTVYWEGQDKSSTGGTISQSNSTSLSWSGLSVDEVHLAGFHKYFTANNQLSKDTGLRKIDNVACYPFALTSSQVQTLHNSSSYYDPNLITGATAIFRMGDGPNDSVANNEIFDTKITTTRKFVKGATTNSDTIVDLLTTDNIYYLGPPSLNALFTTTSNLSISGWFKTTNGATGTLFSNTGGAAATGLKVDVTSSGITASYLSSSLSTSVTGNFNDGEWHHIVMVLSSGSQLIIVDNTSSQASNHALVNDDLRGDNGFTLLGDGQENANNASASTTDASKLQASLSNWSLHTEALSEEGIAQLYSNGHVRNIKNLPSVTVGTPGTAPAIEAWWKLSDTTTPEEDSVGSNDLQFQEANSTPLSDPSILVDADEAVLVEKTLNGNGMTLSLTKKFDFVNEEWVTDASGEAAICLSFNGFEEQAEYFVLWKANQTAKSVNFLDGGWHNLVLSYRGRNDLNSDDDTTSSFVQEGDIVRFGNASAFNWNLSIDGKELNDLANGFGADYIGGLNTLEANNVGFAIYNRHLKFTGNSEETYIAHTQGGATSQVLNGVTVQPPLEEDTPYAFQGYIDETSFHSQNFWQTSTGGITVSNFESEYPAVIYGNTNALPLRGSSAPNYATGIPYPLNDTDAIGATAGTSQYVNPDRLDPTTNPHGGLEAWWRWGDTPQDCAENINDAIDYSLSTVENPVLGHHLRAIEIDQGDLILLSEGPASTYLADSDGTTPATAAVEFVNVLIQGIVNTACNVKDVADPILQYLRVKFKGVGSTDLGKGKTEASLWYRKRRER